MTPASYLPSSSNTLSADVQPIQKPHEELSVFQTILEGWNILRSKPTLRTPPLSQDMSAYKTTTDPGEARDTLHQIDRKDDKIVRDTLLSSLAAFSAFVSVMASSWHRKDDDLNGANITMVGAGFFTWGTYTSNLLKNLQTELNINRLARHTAEAKYNKCFSVSAEQIEFDSALKTVGDAQKSVVRAWGREKQTQQEIIHQLREEIDTKDQKIISLTAKTHALEGHLDALSAQVSLYRGPL